MGVFASCHIQFVKGGLLLLGSSGLFIWHNFGPQHILLPGIDYSVCCVFTSTLIGLV